MNLQKGRYPITGHVLNKINEIRFHSPITEERPVRASAKTRAFAKESLSGKAVKIL